MKSIKLLKLLLVIVPVSVFGKVEDLDKIQAEAIEKIDITEMLKDYDQHLSNIIDKLDPNAKNFVGHLVEYCYIAHKNDCKKTIENIRKLLENVAIENIQDYLLIFCKSENIDTLKYYLDFECVLKYSGPFVLSLDFWKNKILQQQTNHKKQRIQILNSLIKQYNEYSIKCY